MTWFAKCTARCFCLQVETEDLVATLETIVDKFGEDIGPYAVQLCTNLTEAFWKYKVTFA